MIIKTNDEGRKETDRLLAEMEEKIKKEYEKAATEAALKCDKYMQSFQYRDEKKRMELFDGEITQREYNEWRTGQIMTGRRYRDMANTLAEDYHNANNIAKSIVNGYMPEVYALNFNYGTYEVEHGARVDTSFTLYDRNTVEWLFKENPNLLPPVGKKMSENIAAGLDVRWNKQQINSVMLQSILQGESIPKIAKRLAETVGEKNYNSAVRNARTMTTRAENYGRLNSYKRAEKMGIDMQKQWIATLDHVTRDSHVDVDGEVVPVNATFSNGLDCPGGMGPPEEVYNCRCTMVAQIKGFETDASDLNLRPTEALGDMSYDEWKDYHRNRMGERDTAENRYRKAVEEYKQIKNPTEDDLKKVGAALRERMQEVFGDTAKYDQLKTEQKEAWEQYVLANNANNNVHGVWNTYNEDLRHAGYQFTKADSTDMKKWTDFVNATKDNYIQAQIRGLEKQFGELGLKLSEKDTVFDVMTKLADMNNARGDKYNAIKKQVVDLRDKLTGRNAAEALKNELSKIRDMGVPQGVNLREHFNNSRSKNRKLAEEAYNYYPTSWVQNSVDAGNLQFSTGNRGYYSNYRKEFCISGYNDESMVKTSIHELGHRFERTQDGIRDVEEAFYNRRTAGETLEWLGNGYGKNEMTRKDDFFNAYIGKDYGGTAYEVVSMGFENAYMDPMTLWKDPDMSDLMYGILSVM